MGAVPDFVVKRAGEKYRECEMFVAFRLNSEFVLTAYDSRLCTTSLPLVLDLSKKREMLSIVFFPISCYPLSTNNEVQSETAGCLLLLAHNRQANCIS
jgi:hypothetical protein